MERPGVSLCSWILPSCGKPQILQGSNAKTVHIEKMIVYLICVAPGIESYVSLPLESTEEAYWNRPHQLNKKGPSYHVSGKKTSANPQHLRLLVPLKSTEEKTGSPMTPLSENVSNRDTEDLGFSPITDRKPTLILVSKARELGDKKDNQINSPTYWTQSTGQVWFGRVKDDNKISSSLTWSF